jgi:hypothetical protein
MFPIASARRFSLESLEPRQMLSAVPLTFQVVDDASSNKAFRYSESGAAQGSTTLIAANAAPRGVASSVALEKTWVIDANRNVYVYSSASGALMGSWSAGSMANNAAPEGIAIDGTDVWIVDSKSDKVFRYAGAASRLAGSQNAAASFNLNSGNASPKDMVTDGYSLWIVDDAKSDKVFKYNVDGGSLVGSWAIDAANKAPTGIALDPANVGDIWISDSGTDRVYKYAAAVSRNAGGQAAASSFALASGNANPQGLVVAGRPWAETPYQVEWIRQFGTAGEDVGRGVSADGLGNVYVSGWTAGALAVPNPTGETTPFLARYSDQGDPLWIQQPNPTPGDRREGIKVAADGLGNVFQGTGTGSGGPALYNYAPNGSVRWSIPGISGAGLAADGLGNAYVSSTDSTAVSLRKYDGATGTVIWEQALNTGGTLDTAGIAVDGLGNVYVTGYTTGSLLAPNAGGVDGFLAKYTIDGAFVWARQFGSIGDDFNFQVEADALGNVYTSGRTTGSLGGPNAGDSDAFLVKYDGAGNPQWSRQLGTSGYEGDGKIWADGSGNVYMAVSTLGSLGGVDSGGQDISITKYGYNGDRLWSQQIGTTGVEIPSGQGLTGDDLGNLYITGRTDASWAGPNAGGEDVVLIKLAPPAAAAALSSPDASLASRQAIAASSAALASQGGAGASATQPAAHKTPAKRPQIESAFAALATARNDSPLRRAAPASGPLAKLADDHAVAAASGLVATAVDAAFATLL